MRCQIVAHPSVAVLSALMLWASTGLAQSSQPTTQNSAISVRDVAALVRSGQYPDAIRAINRVLPTARGNGTGQDRHELLMLRAESQLHIKNKDAAIATLEEAAKGSEEASDVKGQSEAVAFATLIQRSTNFSYISKTQPDKTPLNILEPEPRKRAFMALFSDEIAGLRAQQNAARTTKSLVPLQEISRDFSRVQAIERTTGGDVKQTTAMSKELSKWATAQIEQAMDDEDSQITKIAADIGRRSGTGSRGGSSVKRGLDQDQSDTLTNIIAECQKIPPMAQELNKTFGQPDVLDTVSRAEAIADRADIILQGGYAPPVKKTSRSAK